MRYYNLAFFGIFIVASTKASLVINEIAYQGSEGVCAGEDWIELHNTGEEALDLANYILHDDNGADAEDSKILPAGVTIAPGAFLLLCGGGEDFDFGIGGDDAVTLLDTTGSIVDSVTLPGTGAGEGTDTYAFIDGEYKYTSSPTPGETNALLSFSDFLEAQEKAGNDFFLVDDADTFGKIVDLHFSIDEEGLAILDDHPNWQAFAAFEEMVVFNKGETTNPLATATGGRIRHKGQSSLYLSVCAGLKTIPKSIQFETPFLGMDTMYLRGFLIDRSFLKDYASHMMLEDFGLPYLRNRPARLFINGEYIGFFLAMEAPTNAYVMQRSFGVFDPEKTGLFKAKTKVTPTPGAKCPEYTDVELEQALAVDPDTPYYSARGEHRDEIEVLGMENITQCSIRFAAEAAKKGIDAVRGYLEYDKNCSLAMVKTGVVDLDFGPKTLEDPMISLWDKIYDESVDDLSGFVDTDQWLRNIAMMTIVLAFDSPLGSINNWYLGTTNGGVGDWKIVQWDHDAIAHPNTFCSASCTPRTVYWPLLRPTCRDPKDHLIVGRILNSEENIQKYIGYIQEYTDIIANNGIIEKLYAYGNDIKEDIAEDPAFKIFQGQTLESYEEIELGRNLEDYNTKSLSVPSFLKTLQVRLEQVQEQLVAIREGTLPRNGVYDPDSLCPDWRDSGSEDYIGAALADDCPSPIQCYRLWQCFDTNIGYACDYTTGEFTNLDVCLPSFKDICKDCYPDSACGTGPTDISGLFVASETCGPDLAECALAATCFSHKNGECAFDGELLSIECKAASNCMPCFPHSRCGSGESPEVLPGDDFPEVSVLDESGAFVPSDHCGPDLSQCETMSVCFDHAFGLCAEDGSITLEDCQPGLPFCKPCFPNSRCGDSSQEGHDSAVENNGSAPVSEPEVVEDNGEAPEKVMEEPKPEDEVAPVEAESGAKSTMIKIVFLLLTVSLAAML